MTNDHYRYENDALRVKRPQRWSTLRTWLCNRSNLPRNWKNNNRNDGSNTNNRIKAETTTTTETTTTINFDKNNMQQLRQRLHATTLTKTTSDDCKIPKTTSTRDFPAPCKTECGYRLLSTSERTAGCTTEHLLKLHFSLLFINKHLKLYFVWNLQRDITCFYRNSLTRRSLRSNTRIHVCFTDETIQFCFFLKNKPFLCTFGPQT